MTRWHGTTTGTGFLAIAVPTARTAPGRPTWRATQAYGRTSPGGMAVMARSTSAWNGDTLRRSTGSDPSRPVSSAWSRARLPHRRKGGNRHDLTTHVETERCLELGLIYGGGDPGDTVRAEGDEEVSQGARNPDVSVGQTCRRKNSRQKRRRCGCAQRLPDPRSQFHHRSSSSSRARSVASPRCTSALTVPDGRPVASAISS